MRRPFRITYDITTPESASDGDTAENGFVEPYFNVHIPVGEISEEVSDEKYGWTLAEAEIFLGRNAMEDSGHWFTNEGHQNYQTGAETRYSLHPPENISGASYGRLARIFGYNGRG